MTWRDKLEIGLKENAAYRKDNLPPSEVSGPEVPQRPDRSAEIPRSRVKRNQVPPGRSGQLARAAVRKGEDSVR
jgi:hypothetical protein